MSIVTIKKTDNDLSTLTDENSSLKERLGHAHDEIERRIHIIKISNRNQFGTKSEKYTEMENNGQL